MSAPPVRRCRTRARALPRLAAGLLLTAVPVAARAQGVDTVAPGVVYREVVIPAGPWLLHVVAVDLRDGRYRVVVRHAHDALRGRERPSAMARRLTAAGDTVVAGINGDFFDLATGENENDQVVDGRVIKGVPVTDSPWDTFASDHSQLAIGADGRPYFGRLHFDASVEPGQADAPRFRLDGLNGVPRSRDALVLFTALRAGASRTVPGPGSAARDPDAAHGPPPRTPSETPGPAVELPLDSLPVSFPGAFRYRVAGPVRPVTDDSIRPGGARLVAYGAARVRLDSLLRAWRGGTGAGRPRLLVRLGFTPAPGPTAELVGGWPRLVTDGRVVAGDAARAEGTFPAFADRRYARSAVALALDGGTLLLVTVDGVPAARRGAKASGRAGPVASAGMTLQEFARALVSLGAWQALNLDGGGSSTLLVHDRVVNAPTDADGERAVGNALFVVIVH